MVDKKTITISTALLILASTLALTAINERCSSLWEETSQKGIYYCEIKDVYRACSKISSTGITCYLQKEAQKPSINTNKWSCNSKECVPF